jgi:hypothetical protein
MIATHADYNIDGKKHTRFTSYAPISNWKVEILWSWHYNGLGLYQQELSPCFCYIHHSSQCCFFAKSTAADSAGCLGL